MVLELGANIAKFETGLSRAEYIAQQSADKIARSMSSATDRLASGLEGIAGKLAAAFSVEKLVEFGKRAIDTADEIGKMAQKVGVSTEILSAYRVQAQLSNVATEGLQSGMAKFARTAADAAAGGKDQAAVFQAIGVATRDAAGNLRPMSDLVQDVAKKFASYEDSASKTALAQQLFGKSGAELIPFLNELGEKSLPEVIKQADEFGNVISGNASKQAETFNDNITRLKLEASGFAQAVVQQVLPNMVALSDQMVQAGKTTDGYSSSASGVATAVKGFVFALLAAKEIVSGVAATVFAFFDAIQAVFSGAGEIIAAWAQTTAKAVKAAFTLDKTGLDAADKEFADRLNKVVVDTTTAFKGIGAGLQGGVNDSIKGATDSWNALFGATTKAGNAAEKTGEQIKKGTAPLVPNRAAADAAASALQRLNDMFAKDGEQLAAIRARIDPVNALYQTYTKTIADAVAQYDRELKAIQESAGGDEKKAQALANLNAKREAGLQVLNESIAAQIKENDVVGRYIQTVSNQQALIGLDDRTKAITEAQIALAEAWKNGNKAVNDWLVKMGLVDPTSEEGRKKIEALAGSLYDQQKAADLAAESAKEWQSIWAQAGNSVAETFAKVLVEGGSLFKSLADLAKQTVEQIIAYFAKLAIINPILNQVFGQSSAFQLLPTLFNTGGLAGSGAIPGGGSYNLLSAGGGSSLLSSAVSIGAGILAGYSAFKSAGGGVGGVASGAAAGYGTYALGTAVSAAVSAGSLTAGLAAIPVVGWIAIGATILNKLTGGALFGTSYKPTGASSTTIVLSDTGTDISNTVQESKKKALFGGTKTKDVNVAASADQTAAGGQLYTALKSGLEAFAQSLGQTAGALIGGTYKISTDKNGKQTFTSTIGGQNFTGDSQDQWASRLQSANFLAVLDKMGLAASQFVGGIAGDADKLAAKVQDFAQATVLANTDLSHGFHFLALSTSATLIDVMKFVEGAQAAGETLTQTYQRLAQAQSQYNQFVAQFVPGTAYVDDFEAAFSGLYHQMLANIDTANQLAQAAGAAGASQKDLTNIQQAAAKQMAALTVQLENSAQALAFSLGLTTKGTLDQVNQSIQSIISSIPTDSAAASSAADEATKSVRNFGTAMHETAKKASDAANLLLGDLSPLNDQQKLLLAAQGLRNGTVTAEQYDEIAKRLYASSEAYVQAFNYAQQFANRVSGGGGRGGGPAPLIATGVNASHVVTQATTPADEKPPGDLSAEEWKRAGISVAQFNKLSPEDQQKLITLLKEQTTLQVAQTGQQFNTLAQQIAEIAAAKGESFQQVIDEMGINNKDLEKGLNLKSDADLNAYLGKLQAQLDSANENTASIVSAINMLPQGIADAIAGKPVGTRSASIPTAQPATPNSPEPPAPGGSSTGPGTDRRGASLPGGRYITDADAEQIGQSTARHIGPYFDSALAGESRSSRRPPATARA